MLAILTQNRNEKRTNKRKCRGKRYRKPRSGWRSLLLFHCLWEKQQIIRAAPQNIEGGRMQTVPPCSILSAMTSIVLHNQQVHQRKIKRICKQSDPERFDIWGSLASAGSVKRSSSWYLTLMLLQIRVWKRRNSWSWKIYDQSE
jgi:hypothetical protein